MNYSATIAFACILAAIVTGCSSTPQLDARFGEAARIVAAQQVIAPEASLNAKAVTGIDGKAAQGAMGEYVKSFSHPEPQPNVMTIGVGTK